MTFKPLHLYHVQDADRPMWVLAYDFGDAERRWRLLVADENDEKPETLEPPMGVHFICYRSELILPEAGE